MEAAGSSEMLVPFNQRLRRHISGESNRYKNHKSQTYCAFIFLSKPFPIKVIYLKVIETVINIYLLYSTR
jgi:hypothetical protein